MGLSELFMGPRAILAEIQKLSGKTSVESALHVSSITIMQQVGVLGTSRGTTCEAYVSEHDAGRLIWEQLYQH